MSTRGPSGFPGSEVQGMVPAKRRRPPGHRDGISRALRILSYLDASTTEWVASPSAHTAPTRSDGYPMQTPGRAANCALDVERGPSGTTRKCALGVRRGGRCMDGTHRAFGGHLASGDCHHVSSSMSARTSPREAPPPHDSVVWWWLSQIMRPFVGLSPERRVEGCRDVKQPIQSSTTREPDPVSRTVLGHPPAQARLTDPEIGRDSRDRLLTRAGQIRCSTPELRRLGCRHPRLLPETIIASDQVSGEAGQAPIRHPQHPGVRAAPGHPHTR